MTISDWPKNYKSSEINLKIRKRYENDSKSIINEDSKNLNEMTFKILYRPNL